MNGMLTIKPDMMHKPDGLILDPSDSVEHASNPTAIKGDTGECPEACGLTNLVYALWTRETLSLTG